MKIWLRIEIQQKKIKILAKKNIFLEINSYWKNRNQMIRILKIHVEKQTQNLMKAWMISINIVSLNKSTITDISKK
jgi:histidinol phosphatase-like PHP family hydrolase